MPPCPRLSRLPAAPGRRRVLGTTLAALAALSLPPAATAADGDWPRRIEHEAGTLVLDAPPARVVSTSPSLTGTLLALDVPLVATAAATRSPLTDDAGFFRQWAEIAHDRGVAVLYPNLAFDFEALLIQDADLVVASASGADSILPHVAELQAMGIPVAVFDYARNDWEELARQIGRATDHEAQARDMARDFTARAKAAAAQMTRPEGSASIVAYNFAGNYGVSKPISAQARVLAELGFEVTGLPEAMRDRVMQSREYDFISHENLPGAITGDSIFLLNGTPEAVERFMADPVLANLPAVQAGQVYPLGPLSFRVDYYSGLAIIETLMPYFSE